VIDSAQDGSRLTLELQRVSETPSLPSQAQLHAWALAALSEQSGPVELVIRIVDEAESQVLNRDYRGKDRPTNVLSFPFEAPPELPAEAAGNLLGDLVICAPVVAREAAAQGKSPISHWIHMVVHGVLHLQGLDHQNDAEAGIMEALERKILASLGVADPYQIEKET